MRPFHFAPDPEASGGGVSFTEASPWTNAHRPDRVRVRSDRSGDDAQTSPAHGWGTPGPCGCIVARSV